MAAVESSVFCSSVVNADVLNYVLSKLGKSELILKDEQKLAIFSLFSGEMFLYGCQRRIWEEYLFPNTSVQLWKTKRVFFSWNGMYSLFGHSGYRTSSVWLPLSVPKAISVSL